MKIVFCGPPHSGKSVLIANLIKKLPSDGYTIVRACPDGEGVWSNNANQAEIRMVRKKGEFTKEFIEDTCQTIDKQTSPIVIVDAGGIISSENSEIFKHCDSFLVISGDKKAKENWMQFGKSIGLNCVGSFDSSLDGKEKLYSERPYIQGNLVGLERGTTLLKSPLISKLAKDLIKRSKYIEKTKAKIPEESTHTVIDDMDIGFELNYGVHLSDVDGMNLKKVKWREEAVPKIYNLISQKIEKGEQVRIQGVRANFVLTTLCKALAKQGAKSIEIYDARTKKYVPIKNLKKKKGIQQSSELEYHVLENEKNAFLDVDITKDQYSVDDMKDYILPKIKREKNLYLSGRIPHWLLASIVNSYDTNKIYTFQPGKGFTCISSANEKELGELVTGPEGIDISKYYKDKKEKGKTNLPAIIKRQGIISRIKRMMSGKENNKKYIDSTIMSEVIKAGNIYRFEKDEFSSRIKAIVSSKSVVSERNNQRNNKEKKKIKDGNEH